MYEITTLNLNNPIIASEANMEMEAAVAAGLISELLELVQDFDSEICDLWMKKRVISYDERITLSTFFIEQCLKAMLNEDFEHAKFLAENAIKEFVNIDVMEYAWAPYISEELHSRIEVFSAKVS